MRFEERDLIEEFSRSGGAGWAECAESRDEGGVAACADGDPGGGAGGADARGEPVAGEGAPEGGAGIAGAEGKTAGRGGKVKREEPESEEKPGDEE